MSKNALGTLLRIVGIFLGVIGFWVVSVATVYMVFGSIFSLDISYTGFWYLFGFVILFRMFYPKNVFV